MRSLQNKVIVFAGAGGIGGATACRLAAEGARLVIGDLDGDAAERAAEKARAQGVDARARPLDLTDESSVAGLFDYAIESFGDIDGLFNVAVAAADTNLGQDTDALEVPLAVWQRTLDVNLTGYLRTIRAALPLLVRRGGGAIVNTISAAAYIGEPTRVSYAVSKAGLAALTRHVATRWGKQGIRCNAVAPGFVPTETSMRYATPEIMDQVLAALPTHRHGHPDDVAGMVAFLLSDDGEWINGQSIAVDGGFTLR